MINDKRTIVRRADDKCPHDCTVCYRYNLQMKWVMSGAVGAIGVLMFLGGVIIANKNDIGVLARDAGMAKIQAEYTIQGINDIKEAMGLAIRMPPKLEALK